MSKLVHLEDEADIILDEDAWARVGSYPHMDSAQEHALVILAMGLPCRIEYHPESGDHDLLVSPDVVTRVRPELKAYIEEQTQLRSRPSIDFGSFSHSPGWSAYFVWLVILMLVHRLEPRYPDLVDACASSSIGLIDHGQLWRPFTALFFHADMVHVTLVGSNTLTIAANEINTNPS